MKHVYTYAHTHWDYEWYFSYNESSIQFIYHMDEVFEALNTGKLNSYILDGQMSILEEYLRVFPEKLELITKLVKHQQLIIGPWFTQTDEMIIDGEAIIRNLYYGIKAAKQLGTVMEIGYLPDSFGQSANMPKIYQGFGIDYSLFWRGVDDRKVKQREFYWRAGSDQVLVYNLKNGYFFGGENWMKKKDIAQVENTFLEKTATNQVLLPVGSDQRNVDDDYLKTIDYYNQNSANELVYSDSTPQYFFDKLKADGSHLPVIEGELLEAQDSKIHRSIYSSRYDHKYLNDKIERRMVNKLEPLMVYANLVGIEFKENLLADIWKTALKNDAHDSACGCNSDKTNNIILNRLKQADELSYATKDYIMRKMCISNPNVKQNELVIFSPNFHQYQQACTIELTTKKRTFELYECEQRLDFDILQQNKVYGGSIKKDKKDEDPNLYYYLTKINLNLMFLPLTIKKIQVVESQTDIGEVDISPTNQTLIEDRYYTVQLKANKLQLEDKRQAILIENWLQVIDDGDDGDTYDYSPPINDCKLQLDFKNAQVKSLKYEQYQQLQISGSWLLPKNLDERMQLKELKPIAYSLKISLNNSKRIDLHLEIDNQVDDHRMRVLLNSPIKVSENFASTPLGTVIRPNQSEIINLWKKLNYKEEPTGIYPFINYCGLKDTSKQVLVMAKGIKEYQIIDDQKVALTLFRSVGYLGKPDLIRRPGIASGNQFKYIPTPASQLHQKLKFKFSYALEGNLSEKECVELTKQYANKPIVYQHQNLNQFTNTLKYFRVNKLDKDVKFVNYFDCFHLQKGYVSAIMPLDSNSSLIRIINPENMDIEEDLKLSSKFEYAYCNMLGIESSSYKPVLVNEKIKIKSQSIVNIKIRRR